MILASFDEGTVRENSEIYMLSDTAPVLIVV